MRLLIFIFFSIGFLRVFAGGPNASFTENKGQWPDHVLYRALVPGGAIFIEDQAFTYVIRSGGDHHHGPGDHSHEEARVHAWRVHFVDGKARAHEGGKPRPHYENFFLGNDPSAWGSECRVFGEVLLKEVWPGIDLRIDGKGGLKYDLIIAPGADRDRIAFRYEGQDAIELKDGEVNVITSVGTLIEKAPVSFNERNGVRSALESEYSLKGEVLTFTLAEHDPQEKIIIDPELSFASFSGSTGDNFGFTATYDDDGHLYGGGIVFNVGYPSTVGVLDPTFNGGTTDVGLSKWSPDGATLIWSTYLGGSESEAPHSLVVNSAHELFVLGSTGSNDFPITAGCLQPIYAGGAPVSFPSGYGFFYNSGADIFVARLNIGATALIGSTYFGGSGSDGLNTSTGTLYNYGDPFRGEIALDQNEDPVISTSTSSVDLPTSAGAPQSSYGGGDQDAFFFRLNDALTALMWGTYHGGSGNDSGFGIQFASNGEIYTTGGTTSSDLPMAGNGAQASYSGAVDGYIARYNAAGSTMLTGTYIGTAQYDQSYFVQLDLDDDVYVVGQTHGNYPITPGKYAVPGSSQFIHKFSGDLSTSIWSTRIGNGNGNEDIAPSAFLVSDCRQIYFSGWGGNTNNGGSSTASTTIGLPTTPGAFQTTTDGSDFYLMVLEPDADALNYATFFGGSSGEHVDGGTSRFDKSGKVYQAVCAGCGGQDDFPTTPGAWSETNQSFNCNLGVFKFDLAAVIAVISIDGPDEVCVPATIQFESVSSGGDTYQWYFGDGGESTDQNPEHTFTEPGTYTVSLVVTDSYGCVIGDSTSIEVTALPPIEASIDPIAPVCPGGEVQLNASPSGQTYAWSPAFGLSATNVQDPIADPGEDTTYQVIVSGACGTDTATVDVVYADPQGSALPDVTICLGESTELGASGGAIYAWEPPETLDDPSSPNPIATPMDTTMYTVAITTIDGCDLVDSVQVNVVDGVPEPAFEDSFVCENGSLQLIGPAADWYQWEAAPGLIDQGIGSPTVSPIAPTTYVLLCGNVCGEVTDSVFVDVIIVEPLAWPDTIVCANSPIELHASGGTTYSWSPASFLDDASSEAPICTPQNETTYTVTVTEDHGCSADATLTVFVHPAPDVLTGPDVIIEFGDRTQLHGEGDGELSWEPTEFLDCTDCPDPWAEGLEESTLFTLTVIDENGCKNSADVWVIVNGSLFVPNTFTPNGDGVNDGFGAWGKDISEFRIMVFNRWGEKIYEAEHLNDRWDGTYKGIQSPIDTYVWRIDMEERSGKRHTLFGHVNLVR